MTSNAATAEKLIPRPNIKVISSTRTAITVAWTVVHADSSTGNEDTENDCSSRMHFRLQMRTRSSTWTTEYWGYKTQIQIEPLYAGECYYFRLQAGIGNELSDWRRVMTSTKEDLPPMIILHRAITQGLAHRARKFLSLRPQCVDVPDRYGRPALLVAAQRGHVELVQLLLAAGADPNGGGGVFASGRTPLMAAAATPSGDRPDVCRALCDRGARWDLRDRNGRTAVHYAAAAGHVGCVQMAVDMSVATAEEVDGRGWTPLMHGVMLRAALDVLSTLAEAAPKSLKKADRLGLTPLHIAALTGQRESYSLLVRLGGDPRQRDTLGHSAQHLARSWMRSADGVTVGMATVDAALTVATAAAALLRSRKRSRKNAVEKNLCSLSESRVVSRRPSSVLRGQAQAPLPVPVDQEAEDQEAVDQETVDQEAADQEPVDQEAADQEPADQEATDQEATDQDATEPGEP